MPEEKKRLSASEIEEIISKFIEWTRYLPDEVGQRWSSFAADIHHSSLLRRLLSGDSIYDYPPPKRFGYPNYELLDKGSYLPVEVYRLPESPVYKKKVLVDQCIWDILEEYEERYIVAYGSVPDKFEVRKIGDRWMMSRIK